MNSLHNHAVKQLQLLKNDLSDFEKNLSSSPLSIQGSINTSLIALKKTLKSYLDLINNQTNDENIKKNKDKHSNFLNQLHECECKFDDLKLQRKKQFNENNKNELFGLKHIANPKKNMENPYANNENHLASAQTSTPYENPVDKIINHNSQKLDYILEMGETALENIGIQNFDLNTFKGKLENSFLTLGMSNKKLKLIKRKLIKDKFMFWIYFILTFIIFIIILNKFN